MNFKIGIFAGKLLTVLALVLLTPASLPLARAAGEIAVPEEGLAPVVTLENAPETAVSQEPESGTVPMDGGALDAVEEETGPVPSPSPEESPAPAGTPMDGNGSGVEASEQDEEEPSVSDAKPPETREEKVRIKMRDVEIKGETYEEYTEIIRYLQQDEDGYWAIVGTRLLKYNDYETYASGDFTGVKETIWDYEYDDAGKVSNTNTTVFIMAEIEGVEPPGIGVQYPTHGWFFFNSINGETQGTTTGEYQMDTLVEVNGNIYTDSATYYLDTIGADGSPSWKTRHSLIHVPFTGQGMGGVAWTGVHINEMTFEETGRIETDTYELTTRGPSYHGSMSYTLTDGVVTGGSGYYEMEQKQPADNPTSILIVRYEYDPATHSWTLVGSRTEPLTLL